MNKKEKNIILCVNVVLILIDQFVKVYMLFKNENNVEISVKNIFTSSNISYILASVIVVSALIRYILKNNELIKIQTRVAVSFAIAGGISNTIDRLWIARVITYKIRNSFEFNLAYMYICIAWVLMAVLLTIYTNKRIKEKRSKNEGDNSR